MPIETDFDVPFVARLAAGEKQIQQNYRPVIGVHKWFARRPGTLFRSLLLAEFACENPLSATFFHAHSLKDVTICDPFMGGGTSLFEANRMGCNVVGLDINPMAYWIVRQELSGVDRRAFRAAADTVARDVESRVQQLYLTRCCLCQQMAPVKYFLWVKQQCCAGCGQDLDLFPGYLVAGNARHTHFVVHCPSCKQLVQFERLSKTEGRVKCPECNHRFDWRRGQAARNRYQCDCGHAGRYPAESRLEGPPRHRLFGLEYHCPRCRESHRGRFFKTAGDEDARIYEQSAQLFAASPELPIPDDEIPDGDETKRLHRWGYRKYREMFNDRQLLALGLLSSRIRCVRNSETRHALATVFSDFLRYQNLLCRYDTYALKCQDIFAVHGFPVGLVQCENNVIGIPGVGAGGFRQFVDKYDRAKAYCEQPFETVRSGGRKTTIPIEGERIDARLVATPSDAKGKRTAFLKAGSAEDMEFGSTQFDGVLTDPPYFDNVQYAELMDFCYSWLRPLLGNDFPEFSNATTRSSQELTGNTTLGRDLAHFTTGLSKVFCHVAGALKPGAPFVFTYHHNDVEAYVPIVVAILDAQLACTATLPCPAEMSASLHINGTGSSIVDTIVVCRLQDHGDKRPRVGQSTLRRWLADDREKLYHGGVRCTQGDLYCLAFGHLARVTIRLLSDQWDCSSNVDDKMDAAHQQLSRLVEKCEVAAVVEELLNTPFPREQLSLEFGKGLETSPLD